MKKRLKRKVIIIKVALLLFATSVFAKQQKTEIKPSNVIIEGKITDSNINTMPNAETEILLMISKLPFNTILMQKAKHISYKIKVKDNQRFRFVLPALAERFYMFITYKAKSGTNHWSTGLDNLYILEKGDRITCTLTNDIFKFSGKGSDKLNCQSELIKVQWKTDEHLMKIYRSDDFSRRHQELFKRQDSCLVLRKAIVEKYRSKLGTELSDMMLVNCYGLRYWTPLRNERVSAQHNSKNYAAFIASDGYKNIDYNIANKLPANLLVSAPIYTDFLFEKIMMQTRVFINGKIENNFSPGHMKKVYDHIKSNYTGIIREKLLTTFFVQWQNEPTIFDYQKESLVLINDVTYRETLLDLIQKGAKGRAFFSFELEDDLGKTVKLKDLNDKIIIVDFWYTGCLGCANLKLKMQGVWESYKDNPKVKFVSISIDKDKLEWRKSILSKRYTEPAAINLYTNGLGKDHPIISSEQIIAYPRMYLLKQGKIYSANLPYPSGPDTTKGTTKDFIDLIEKAIAEN